MEDKVAIGRNMQKPSRLMPKFKSRVAGPLGSSVFLLVLASPLFIIMWLLPFTIAVTPILLFVVYKNYQSQRNHFIQLSKGRKDDSICTFARHFDSHNIDTWIIRAVYEETYNYVSIPVRPTDNIYTDLKFEDILDELEMLEAIAKRTGRSMDNYTLNPYYGKANTLEGLVFFFNGQPRIEAT